MDKQITAIANRQVPCALGFAIFGDLLGMGAAAAPAKRVRTHVTKAVAVTATNAWGPDAWSPPV